MAQAGLAEGSIDGRPTAAPGLAFGPFRLIPSRRLLLEDGRPVAIGGRAFHILLLLLERAGEVVGKEQIAARVWPDTVVEEANLRVHLSSLRRVLRDGELGRRFIVNVPGRGYSFVGAVHHAEDEAPRAAPPDAPLPALLTRVIGRAEVLEALRAALPLQRCITLVGPGGIGKTTVALALARDLAPAFRDGACFVDLSAAAGTGVAAAIAAALRLPVQSGDALPALALALQDRQMLLLLDSCEHVAAEAAAAIERIGRAAPGMRILATSLEPLRAAGEHVRRLEPLAAPPGTGALTAAEALAFPGVQLLVERAAEHLDGFELTEAEAPHAAQICRRLDGIPLAIELAAGRLGAFGMRDLAARLDDRFDLLTAGRRTALARHQTLAATLDWSFQLLEEPGRRLLRHLAVFSGAFSLADACALRPEEGATEVALELAGLVSRSLVSVDLRVEPSRFRLLETTRLYALRKLEEAGEDGPARRRHARHLHECLAAAEADSETMPAAAWVAAYGSQLDNVRAALDWAAGTAEARGLCIALTVRAVPLWVQLSLMGECKARVEHALGLLGDGPDAAEARIARMKLSAALGWSLMYAEGRSEAMHAAWATVRAIAEELGDAVYLLRGLWGLCTGALNRGDVATALHLARRLGEVAGRGSDAQDAMMADRVLATTLHYHGQQDEAQHHMERMLSRHAAAASQPRVVRFRVDQKVMAHYFLARILWLRGRYGAARRLAAANIEEGRRLGHALTFCSVLGQSAGPIALLSGDVAEAARLGAALRAHAERHGLRLWHDWACGFEAVAAIHAGEAADGVARLRAALAEVGDRRFLPRFMLLHGELALALGTVGEAEAGLEAIDGLVARCERSGERWYVPEALRIKAELLRRDGRPGAADAAEAALGAAAALAARQQARAWSLRIATSLARLRLDAGEAGLARTHLAAILADVPEDAAVADLRMARSLLAA